jgi:hypothetical protein
LTGKGSPDPVSEGLGCAPRVVFSLKSDRNNPRRAIAIVPHEKLRYRDKQSGSQAGSFLLFFIFWECLCK